MRKRVIVILVVVVGAAIGGVLVSRSFGRQDQNRIKLSGNGADRG
jgi:NADH:ubiquinone oxidoreductase subunit 3 (subunit A)